MILLGFQKILQHFTPAILFQFLGFLILLGLTSFLSRHKFTYFDSDTLEAKFGKNLKKVVEPLKNYVIFVFLLFILSVLSIALFGEAQLTALVIQFSLIYLFTQYAYQLTQSKLLSILVFGGIFITWSAKHFMFMAPVNSFLEQYSLTIGTFVLTPETFVRSIIVIAVFIWVTSILSSFGRYQIDRMGGVRGNTKTLLQKAYDVVLFFLALALGFQFLGINLTAFTVLGGALGVGIGFGLQKITSNFISGIILIAERSIKKGDLIEMDGGVYGLVKIIGSRYTLIEMYDGKEVFIPNEDFITSRVTNWTYSNKTARVDVTIGVAYKSDLRLVQKLILEAALENPKCAKAPLPDCYLTEFADSSVNFLLVFYVDDVKEGRWGPKSDVLFAIWEKFKENHIEIPFPQQDIYLKDVPDSLKKK